jgi:hypothetical protein
MFALPNPGPALYSVLDGSVAEWLGSGLQNLVQRFESARNLTIHIQRLISFGVLKLKVN